MTSLKLELLKPHCIKKSQRRCLFQPCNDVAVRYLMKHSLISQLLHNFQVATSLKASICALPQTVLNFVTETFKKRSHDNPVTATQRSLLNVLNKALILTSYY